MLVVYLGIAWFIGLWLASATVVNPYYLLAGGLLSLIAALLLRRYRTTAVILACVGVIGLAGFRCHAALPIIDESHVAYYNDTDDITLTGLVAEEPEVTDRSINLRLEVESVTLPDGRTLPAAGLVQVRAYRYPEIEYGMKLELYGRLETPPADGDFNYRAYLERQNIYSLMSLPRVTVLAEEEGHPLYHAILAVKHRAQDSITQLLPAPQSALLSGILLGNDNGMPPDLADDFRNTGMTHIIAISGFNIAILIAILMGLTGSWLPQRPAVIVSITGIAFYTIMVGADASVVRAAVMGSIYLVAARWMGRPNFAFASLFLAGWLMTLLRPFTLWDVGFQLSFTATLGLMLYADGLTQWTRRQLLRVADRQTVRQIMAVISEAVLITLAAQILTLPLMVGYFRQVSLISLPANALILPAQPGVMIWGGLATIVGMISPLLAQPLAWAAWLFLTYTISLVRMFARVPGAAVPVDVSWTAVILIYVFIGAATWLVMQPPETRARWTGFLRRNLSQKAALTLTGMAALLVISWNNGQADGKLHIAFLNVGQGDATFIQTPSGRQILIDGGLYPSVLNDQLGQQMPFWDKEIDLVIATHPDADHVSGLADLFARYRIPTLITDGEGLGESHIYDAVLQAAEANGAEIRRAVAGEIIEIEDGVRLEILHPGDTLNAENRNENSVSMRLVYGEFSYLFTGDAEQEAEQAMLANGRPLNALVFKAGHHGSNSSSSAPFLTAVQPQIIIVSAGKDNKFGHPRPEMLQRARDIGATVLRTDELGTIEVVTDGRIMWWQARP
ncbi:MAG TPA: DNA internalization-related competence protein ComEC/Rec2 [Anaerolineae bacterium]|nr:DNA internalization-related competence protein ComEC/Rec2 [Anaerolineae bacterium]